MMKCKLCHLEIDEFIKWLFLEKRQIRRYECPLHGALHFRTMLPMFSGQQGGQDCRCLARTALLGRSLSPQKELETVKVG